MLERKIYKDLLEWKNKKDKKVLIVKGAHQVGKTYIIDKFARENYDFYIYINFIQNDDYKTIFDGSFDVDTIIKQVSLLIPNAQFIPRKTLIFLDEIQVCPKVIAALKFLSIDNRFDVIASGINYKEVSTYPNGYVEHLEMHSMDFEEFCWANGISKQFILDIKEYFISKREVPIDMHDKMMSLFKEYIVVGGMPRVVNDFVNNHNFLNVLNLQKGIIDDYANEIMKYVFNSEKTKAKACFLSISKHLAQDYKKFRYGLVEKGAPSGKYSGSLMWLYDAGIINFCYNLSKPELPFEGNSRSDVFKVYMRDTGLLMAMLEDGAQKEIIDGNLGIYKGAIYENIIADIFTKLGKKLYYFEHNSTLEIDFFIKYENVVTAVEVKSADNIKAKSLNSVINNWGVNKGIKLSSKNIGVSDKIINYPLYMAMFL